jgi:predicted permease
MWLREPGAFRVDDRAARPDGSRVVILNTLAPVFLLIALGAVLQRTNFVSPGFLREANRVTYWLGLPALLFSQLAGSFHQADGARSMLLTMLLATAAVVVAAYGIAWAMRIPGSAMGTFVQGGFRGNLAFVALPIVYALPETTLAGGLSARAAAIILIAPMTVVYNLVGVVVLSLSQHRLGFAMIWPLLRQLATTPPLLATFAGIVFAAMGWTLPGPVEKTFSSLGEMALPLGLLGVGGSLITVKLHGAWQRPLAAALVKAALSPLLGWFVGRWLGLGHAELKMILIMMACPTAIVSYTIALEMKGDEAIASGSIVLSVFASVAALAIIVGAF